MSGEMRGEGGVSFIMGRRGHVRARCVVRLFDQVPRDPTFSLLASQRFLFLTLLLFFLSVSSSHCSTLCLSIFPSGKKQQKKKPHFHVHLMSPGQKRKMIQTMEVSTYQLFVAISSRLPQSALGPGIKCKTETPH